MKTIKTFVLFTFITSIFYLSSVASCEAQVMVHSDKGVDFLYQVYKAVNGGYKVKLIIKNNTNKSVETNGAFKLEFEGGGWIQMTDYTISPNSQKTYVYDGTYKTYPKVKRWFTPSFNFR